MKKKVIYILLAVLSILRLWLGDIVGLWLPADQIYDDALLIKYSDFASYLTTNAERIVSERNIMLKDLGMPFILNLVSSIGIKYSTFLSLLWIIAAILTFCLIKRSTLKHSDIIGLLSASVVLFQPVAFDDLCGTRLYRSGLLTPLYLIVILIVVSLFYDIINQDNYKKIIIKSLVLGFVFSITYYIKEDGLWLLSSVFFVIIFAFFVSVIVFRKDILKLVSKALIGSLLPIVIIFVIVTMGYKMVNYHYFGIWDTNVRTSGEMGEFLAKMYKTKSDYRTVGHWAPYDVVDTVFNNSETLKANTELYNAIMYTYWFGDLHVQDVPGDFMGWVVKDALFDSGTVTTKKEAEDYLSKVNDELDAAFENGDIEEDTMGIRVVSQAPAIRKTYIKDILKYQLGAYRIHIFLYNYEAGSKVNGVDFNEENMGYPEVNQIASVKTNMNFNVLTDSKAIYDKEMKVSLGNRIVRADFILYKILQPFLFFAAVICMIIHLVKILVKISKKQKSVLRYIGQWLLAASMIGISFVYSFLISRFSIAFAGEGLKKMYSVGVVPLMIVFEIICILLFCEWVKEKDDVIGSIEKKDI